MKMGNESMGENRRNMSATMLMLDSSSMKIEKFLISTLKMFHILCSFDVGSLMNWNTDP